MRSIHIASAANAAYFPGLEVLVCSTLLHTSREAHVHFHVFDDGIAEKDWAALSRLAAGFNAHAAIHRIQFTEERLQGFPTLNGSKTTYARLLLGEYLPQVSRVIYLDSDILVGRDVQELVDFDMKGRTALATDDALFKRLDEDCPWLPKEVSAGFRYFNAGVLVLDLDRWRKFGYMEKCLAAITSSPEPCKYWDQTALNYILREDVETLPQAYNHFSFFTESLPATATGLNFHLVSAKPWLGHAHRFDHYLWRAFYEEVIDPEKRWATDAPLKDRVFNRLPFHPATKGLFVLAMRVLISRSNHAHQRQMREQSLRTALESPALLARARSEWRAHLAAGAAPLSAAVVK